MLEPWNQPHGRYSRTGPEPEDGRDQSSQDRFKAGENKSEEKLVILDIHLPVNN